MSQFACHPLLPPITHDYILRQCKPVFAPFPLCHSITLFPQRMLRNENTTRARFRGQICPSQFRQIIIGINSAQIQYKLLLFSLLIIRVRQQIARDKPPPCFLLNLKSREFWKSPFDRSILYFPPIFDHLCLSKYKHLYICIRLTFKLF